MAKLTNPTVFISASSDMAPEVQRTIGGLRELERRLNAGKFDVYFWGTSETQWDGAQAWQNQIPDLDDPAIKAVIVLLGERVGLPLTEATKLPAEFPLSDLAARGVVFPHDGKSLDTIPLTGTLFEYFAVLERLKNGGKVPLLVFMRADRKTASNQALAASDRGWGYHQLYDRLGKEGVFRGRSNARSEEYYNQIDWLTLLHDRFLKYQPIIWIDGPDGLAKSLEPRLTEGLGIRTQQRTALWGLSAYDVDDCEWFVGRKDEIDKAHRRLLELNGGSGRDPDPCALFLNGQSGAGKSSLLRAGVIGTLVHRRHLSPVTQGAPFTALVFKPTELAGPGGPVAGFAAALARLPDPPVGFADRDAEKLRTLFANLPAGAERLAELRERLERSLAAGDRRLLIGIDQFEEIFDRFDGDKASKTDWTRLLELLFALSKPVSNGAPTAHSRLWLVAAIPDTRVPERNELLGGVSSARGFAEMTIANPGLVQIEKIVDESFATVKARVEPALSQDLVKRAVELAKDRAVLPLISLAMTRTVDAWMAKKRDRLSPVLGMGGGLGEAPAYDLELGAYTATIDPADAVETLAEEAWREAYPQGSAEDESALHALLRRMVVSDLRRSIALTAVERTHRACRSATQLVEALRKRRLVQEVSDSGKPAYALSHLAIVDNWPRARAWYDREHKLLPVLMQLEVSFKEWQKLPDDERAAELTDFYPAARYWKELEGILWIWGDDLDERSQGLHGFLCGALAHHKRAKTGQLSWEDRPSLMIAAMKGTPALVQAYLDAGCDIDERSWNGWTALMSACYEGRYENTALLLGRDPKPDINAVQMEGWTPLMSACANGHAAVVELLLKKENKINTEAVDKNNWTPFMMACANGHVPVLRLLLSREPRPSIEAVAEDLPSPLILACAFNHLEAVEFLLTQNPKPEIDSSYNGGLGSLAGSMIENRDVAAALRGGSTPLLVACTNGHLAIAEQLLRQHPKPQIDAVDWDDLTPLMKACIGGHVSIVELLLRQDPMPTIDKYAGDWGTAFTMACDRGSVEIVRHLVNSNQPVNINAPADVFGRTGLMHACAQGNRALVRFLLDRSPGPNLLIKDYWGKTALDYAERRRDRELVKWLVDSM